VIKAEKNPAALNSPLRHRIPWIEDTLFEITYEKMCSESFWGRTYFVKFSIILIYFKTKSFFLNKILFCFHFSGFLQFSVNINKYRVKHLFAPASTSRRLHLLDGRATRRRFTLRDARTAPREQNDFCVVWRPGCGWLQ
jgi:hypothetical protein